ncbi:hypothetical protein LKO27_00390 [Tessaracoccus sp. OS52]|uniref:CarD family transcriptional regulator n=1 Tax=Tessaracoccus sp. OS52 TaxID=2886691 RepID=UPI001D129EE1|nr:CarD family transcriptional regulator [Tessaracoccus sp. OS52]MCC2591889.1 hypothetical protein [Tessaracoccus sp. OS52]
MQLVPGQTVIHPHHGPATVTRRLTRSLRGESVEYAELLVAAPPLTITVPVSKADYIGLREVASESQLDRLAAVLCADTDAEEETWSRRVKAHGAKLLTGELRLVAEVARDILRRQDARGVSMAEKEILRDALRPVVAEVAVAVGVSEDDAEQVIKELALTRDRSVLDHAPAA